MRTLGLGLLLALLSAIGTYAQTYPQSNAPFYCDRTSTHPLTSFWQFACRGLYYDGDNIEFFFLQSRVEFFENTPAISGRGAITSGVSTEPNTSTDPVTPGTFKFTWAFTDENGVAHTGATSGLWVNYQLGRYWGAKILSSSITLN
jgi:hypothetical protein